MAEESFESDINLNGNQLKNITIDLVDTDPVGPTVGRFWYNQTSGRLKYCDPDGIKTIPFLGFDSALGFIIYGGGGIIQTGLQGDIIVPFNCQIKEVNLIADQQGSIVVDIEKSNLATYPGGFSSITASAAPTITDALKSTDNTLTGWSVDLLKDDILRFNVLSNALITRLLISLKIIKT